MDVSRIGHVSIRSSWDPQAALLTRLIAAHRAQQHNRMFAMAVVAVQFAVPVFNIAVCVLSLVLLATGVLSALAALLLSCAAWAVAAAAGFALRRAAASLERRYEARSAECESLRMQVDALAAGA